MTAYGDANGIEIGLGDLAIRYLLVGLVVILIRGIVTELITARMLARRATNQEVAA
ncbi:MAG: PTS glucitol/sorbitol transporter subunit IIC [Nocardioides sp.]